MHLLDFLYPRLKRVTSNRIYLAEIDGLRFFAISLVLLFHIYGYFHARFNQAIIHQGEGYSVLNHSFVNGDRGVQLFFVLSGFILCLPFAQSYKNNTPQPDIKKYYWRRLTRLEPPYIIAMTLLFFAAVLMYSAKWKLLLSSLLASLFYIHGFVFQDASFINVVAWSLEIEVQFYLLAPLLFQIFRLNTFWRRLIIIVMACVAAAITYFYFAGGTSLFHQIPFFLAGILLADWYVHDQYDSLFSSKWTTGLAIFLFPVLLFVPWKMNLFALLMFLIAIFLFYYSVLKNDVLKAVFSKGWIPIIGGMCYSIYLLHYPIISLVGRQSVKLMAGDLYLVNLLVQFFLMITTILLVSTFFYLVVERPFMAGGWQWSAIKAKLGK